MTHLEEYKRYKTIGGWTEDQIMNTKKQLDEDVHWGIKLQLKDVKGNTTLTEKIMIEIDSFLQYNNIDYLSEKEIKETAKKITKLIKDNE